MDASIEKMSVSDLRKALELRGEDSRGLKPVLQERLREVLKEEAIANKMMEDGQPQVGGKLEYVKTAEDARSVHASEAGRSVTSRKSAASTVASARKIEAAKAAGLKAKAAALQKKYELEQEELKLKQKKEQLEIAVDLAECIAKGEALADDDMDRASDREGKQVPLYAQEKDMRKTEVKVSQEQQEKQKEVRKTEVKVGQQQQEQHVLRKGEEVDTKRTTPEQNMRMSEGMYLCHEATPLTSAGFGDIQR